MSVFSLPKAQEDNGVYLLFGEVESKIFCKIGMSSFLRERMMAVISTAPFEIKKIIVLEATRRAKARLAERSMHIRLSRYISNGEWFVFNAQDQKQKEDLKYAIETACREQSLKFTRLNIEEFRENAKAILKSSRKEVLLQRKRSKIIARDRRRAKQAKAYALKKAREEQNKP